MDYSLARKRPSQLTPSRSIPKSPHYIFEDVSGSPTRTHWKPDSESTHCDYIGCSTRFNLLERRHHCRKCGGIFCSVHCSNYFRLDQFAQFHPRGTLARGCDGCASDFTQWQQRIGSYKRKTIEQDSTKASVIAQSREIPTSNNEQVTSSPIPSSVPADWQWSTF